MSKENKYLQSISCRNVGPGGTTVQFFATSEGVKCIWTNENCPYDFDGVTIDEETDEASDGHNVSMLTWDKLEAMLKNRPKN
jgi:hypothetical protein